MNYREPGTSISQSICQAAFDAAIEKIMNSTPPKHLYFYTSGTGIPDEYAIKYWSDTNVVVVDRNWQKWLHGEKFEEDL